MSFADANADSNADRGGGGQKIRNFCGHHMWNLPKAVAAVCKSQRGKVLTFEFTRSGSRISQGHDSSKRQER